MNGGFEILMKFPELGRATGPLRPPGMRIYKTVLGVFICLLINLLRADPNTNTFYACITCIIAMKGDIQSSIKASFFRIESTILGALAGIVALEGQVHFGMNYRSVAYYLYLSAILVVLIWLNASFLHADSVVLSSIVLLSIALNHITDANPAMFALHRFIDTAIGVIVALSVNRLLPQAKPHSKPPGPAAPEKVEASSAPEKAEAPAAPEKAEAPAAPETTEKPDGSPAPPSKG